MCDLFKTSGEFIDHYFGSKAKYDEWETSILNKLNNAEVSFSNTTNFIPMLLFPEKKEEKTEGGIYKPEISEMEDGVRVRVGKQLFSLVKDINTKEATYVIRPYGNIDLSNDVWLVPEQNILFSIRK